MLENQSVLLENTLKDSRSAGGTNGIDILHLDIKQESLIAESDMFGFHSSEDEIKYEMDIIPTKISYPKIYMNTDSFCGLSSDTGPAEDITSNNLLALDIKQECDMNDFQSSEIGNVKCEMDSKIFSIENETKEIVFDSEPCCVFSADIENFSDDKFKIDTKNSINLIQETSAPHCTDNHIQGPPVKRDLSDFKISKNILIDRADGTSNSKQHVREVLNCSYCNYSSFNKGNIHRHTDEVHLKIKKFKCDFCKYSSTNKRNLQKHTDGVHLKLKKFTCHLCEYSAADKSILQRHIDGLHLKLRKFKCHLCVYSLADKASLQRHIDAIHLKLKKLKCHLCEYRSDDKANLQKHINKKHTLN